MFNFEPRLLAGTVLLWGAAGFLCRFWTPETPLGARWGQWAFGLVALPLFVSLRPVRRFAADLPRAHAFLLAIFFVLLLGAQLLDRSRQTFPFVSWKMFSMPAPAELGPIEFYEYYGTTDSAERVRLNPARLVPSLKNYRMTVGLMKQLDAAHANAEAGRRLSETLRALGRLHNRDHPDAPVRDVEVYRCQLDPRQSRDRRATHRWRVWSAEVSP